jgi:hypothetical protein
MSSTPAPAPAPLRLRAWSKYIIQCSCRSLGGGIRISVHLDTKSVRICDLIACRGQNLDVKLFKLDRLLDDAAVGVTVADDFS